jgi:hypothetical protein
MNRYGCAPLLAISTSLLRATPSCRDTTCLHLPSLLSCRLLLNACRRRPPRPPPYLSRLASLPTTPHGPSRGNRVVLTIRMVLDHGHSSGAPLSRARGAPIVHSRSTTAAARLSLSRVELHSRSTLQSAPTLPRGASSPAEFRRCHAQKAAMSCHSDCGGQTAMFRRSTRRRRRCFVTPHSIRARASRRTCCRCARGAR